MCLCVCVVGLLPFLVASLLLHLIINIETDQQKLNKKNNNKREEIGNSTKQQQLRNIATTNNNNKKRALTIIKRKTFKKLNKEEKNYHINKK
jgi:mannitol-specific phosphotransferase system IIBC component